MWDDDTETEPNDGKYEATSEKSFLDAIRDGLNLIETQNNHSTAPTLPLANPATTATALGDESEEDDEEEISILDFLLNGEKIFSSTTANPLNTVTLPSNQAAGVPFTNSPMHIQPILPDEVKNGSMKFAMLPMSLYNMVKEDGTIVFDGNNGTQIVARTPIRTINAEGSETTTDATTEEISTTFVPIEAEENKTTSSSVGTTNLVTESSTGRSEADWTSTFETTSADSTTIASIETKDELDINQTASRIHPKPPSTTILNGKEGENVVSTSMTPVPNVTERTTTAVIANETSSRFATTTIELEASASTLIASTESTNHLTTMRPPVIIDSNPSILESDLNYDYSEPTLPPSLPNLKIIPFLPTDAVKPSEPFSRQKGNYVTNNNQNNINNNYYASHLNPYSGGVPSSLQSNPNYSPFSGKPPTDKYPVYNNQAQLAGDRLDYDGYNKPGEDNLPNIDYGNVYSISGIGSGSVNNVVSGGVPFVHGGVDSKLEFDTFNQKVHAKPPPKNTIATTTVKNLLNINRFETPYNDLFQVARPRPTNIVRPPNDFIYNNPIPNKYADDTYLAQYQRQPDFDDDYALPNEHAAADGGVAPPKPLFNYAGKNNFIPPLQTEGK